MLLILQSGINSSFYKKSTVLFLIPAKRPAISIHSLIMPSHEPYCFIHLPKTAGTSFKIMLERYFSQSEIYPSAELMKTQRDGGYPDWRDYLRFLSTEEYPSIQLFMGHISFAVAQRLAPRSHLLTFLREPESRFQSNVYFIEKVMAHRGLQMTLEEAYFPYREKLKNLQVAFFADSDADHQTFLEKSSRINSQALAQAKENLASCGFVGISEHFAESIKGVETKFGWKLGNAIHENQTSKGPRKALPSEILKDMEEATAYDKELYHFACALFEEQKKGGKRKRWFFF